MLEELHCNSVPQLGQETMLPYSSGYEHNCNIIIFLGTTVRFEFTEYHVYEREGSVNVCTVLNIPSGLAQTPFNLTISLGLMKGI